MAETMLRLNCQECNREFVVLEDDLDDEALICPHCGEDVPVDQDSDVSE